MINNLKFTIHGTVYSLQMYDVEPTESGRSNVLRWQVTNDKNTDNLTGSIDECLASIQLLKLSDKPKSVEKISDFI